MTSTQTLPATHRALVLTSTSQPPEVKTIPTPQPSSGSAVIRIESANIISYSKDIYNGTRNYPFPTPLVIGTSAIGRVAATGPDAVLLEPDQLVWIDCFVRGRDDPGAAFLLGVHEGHSERAKKLMRGEWRDATYAEYAKIPLENCYPLDEAVLGRRFGLIVPYGGLRDIALQPGETIIIAPATGAFGRAAVKVALAMGARVIAMGRNASVLAQLAAASSRVSTVQITGDEKADLRTLQSLSGSIDAYLDISPPAAANSTHFRSCILALGHGARVSLMGSMAGSELALPLSVIVRRGVQIRGKWMYERSDVRGLIGMVECGVLELGGQKVERFGLEEWESGFERAAEFAGDGAAIIVP